MLPLGVSVSVGLSGLAIPAGCEAKARAFYEGVLQIPETIKPGHLAKRGGCWSEKGALKVPLGVNQDFRPAKKANPAFLVDDLKELSERLAAAEHPVRSEERLDGYRRVYVDDPFGN